MFWPTFFDLMLSESNLFQVPPMSWLKGCVQGVPAGRRTDATLHRRLFVDVAGHVFDSARRVAFRVRADLAGPARLVIAGDVFGGLLRAPRKGSVLGPGCRELPLFDGRRGVCRVTCNRLLHPDE